MRSLFLILILFGCVTTANFERNLDRAIGHNISTIIRADGAPNKVFKLPDGTKAYEFVYDNGQNVSNQFGIVTIRPSSCVWTYYTDSRNIVRDWTHKGNYCRRRE